MCDVTHSIQDRPLPRLRAALALGLLLSLSAQSRSAQAEPETVEILARDEFRLQGSLWAQQGSAPAVLLLHQCNSDRGMYDQLGRRLQSAGFHVLAVDLRGLGESTSDDFDLQRDSSRNAWDRATAHFGSDVSAVYDHLLRSVTILDGRVGALGASCGGALQIQLAAAQREIDTLVFLSARLSEQEIVQLRELARLPILFIAAEGDRRAAAAARSLNHDSHHADSRAILYRGSAHGYPLLEQDPDLIGDLVGWFRSTLMP